MYRMPEKQTWSPTVSSWDHGGCSSVCKTSFPSNWVILAFFPIFWLASFHFILFLWKHIILSCQSLCFQQDKLNVVFTATASNIECIFASLTRICKLPYIWGISLHGDKNITFDFSVASLFGTLFILTYNQDFLSFASNYNLSKVLIQWNYEYAVTE